eukprot:CAMPEP_0116830724 /NCGR_PEP_ID=MMETSP0418-20121206/4924_1 /TAXON_ID=1158023 /ORGANISM="Astrosyne radiata, Strain 13vi08-1A" /LENGTH=275 /DNA_ID=CAMNT_0004459863 /DNA_START=135 /DNA_END=962 /DNA_ORIENTATION=-
MEKKRTLEDQNAVPPVANDGGGKMPRNHTFNATGMEDDKRGAGDDGGGYVATASHNLNARRCTSDTSLWRSGRTGSNGAERDLAQHQRNAMMLMGQRSNAEGVKALVASLKAKSDNPDAVSETDSPLKECAMLAQIANDAYYRVVIGSAKGVETLIKAMKAFPGDPGVQEYSCTALGFLCERNASYQATVSKNDGVPAIVAAMRSHPQSIAVQSAACDALRKMSALILADAQEAGKQIMPELVQLLQHAKVMYITPQGRESAEHLLAAIAESGTQ